MRCPIDVNRQWRFLNTGDLNPNGVAVEADKKGGKVVFKTPFGAISTMILEMGHYDKKLGTITATYSIQEGRQTYSDTVVLSIEQKVKDQAVRLMGFPEGFHGNQPWRFIRV